MIDLSVLGLVAGLVASLLFIYLATYCAGKGWFKARLEFQRKHMQWMNTELSDG